MWLLSRLASLFSSRSQPSVAPLPVSGSLAAKYQTQFVSCVITAGRVNESSSQALKILKNKKIYQKISINFPGMPWWVVGIIHSMECDCDFSKHLHNGDSLKARTVQVPRGRPVSGNPPFSFYESAIDALKYDKFDTVTDWSIGNALVLLEQYNGTGYRKRGVPSPYLWSFTDQYRAGKFIADGVYSSSKVSTQCGCAALLKYLTV